MHRILGFSILVVISLAIAALVTAIVGYSGNTLRTHPDWILGKRLLSNSVMGSGEAVSTRNLLKRNRLNLEVWHGFQEVILHRLLQPGEVSFGLRLEKDAYLYAWFNRTEQGFAGFRISRSDRLPSMFFRARPDGGFLQVQTIENLVISQGWHTVELAFQQTHVALAIDGRSVGRFREPVLAKQVIGFRSGLAGALVDDVKVLDSTGRLVIDEDFDDDVDPLPFFAIAFAGVLGVSTLVYLLRAQAIFGIVTAGLVLMSVLSVYQLFDWFVWSGRYPYQETPSWWQGDIGELELGFERARARLFDSVRSPVAGPDVYDERPESLVRFLGLEVRSEKFEDLTVTMGLAGSRRIDRIASERDAVAAYLKQTPLPEVSRLLLLGTSQLRGSGANHPEERIAQSLQRVLSEVHGWNTVVIDAAKPGSRSGELLARYRDHLSLLEPTLVLVNLSNNDGRVKEFERNLQAIVDVGRSLRAATVFVKEANSSELEDGWLRKKHAAVSRVASKNQIPVIDLHGHLSGADLHDSGMLWWDPVHMTSYGQARTAELLADNIAGILRAQGAGLLDQSPSAPRSRQVWRPADGSGRGRLSNQEHRILLQEDHGRLRPGARRHAEPVD